MESTQYVIVEKLADGPCYVATYRDDYPALLPPSYSWTGKAKDAKRFKRAGAVAAAERLEATIMSLYGFCPVLLVRPARGGACCSRS